MLDLTYIFPDEPIEEDSLYVIDHLPHAALNRRLSELLKEQGIVWHGAQSNSTHPEYIQVNLGCLCDDRARHGIELMHYLTKQLKPFCWKTPRGKFYAGTITQSGKNLWVHLVAHVKK